MEQSSAGIASGPQCMHGSAPAALEDHEGPRGTKESLDTNRFLAARMDGMRPPGGGILTQ